MRILIVSQYFAPEMTAASARLLPFAEGLAARGHAVDVLAALPNHPQGRVYPGFRGKVLARRRGPGFRTTYVWVHATPAKGLRSRLLNYASFSASAAIAGGLRRDYDVVLASSPPLSVGVVGLLLARLQRVPLVFDVRDLWPEIAVVLGEISNPRAISLIEALERRLYRSAAAVTTPTQPFADHIDRVAGVKRATVIPNGTTQRWIAAGESSSQRDALGLPEDCFLWTYAGNVGLSQDLETAVRAAARLGEGFRLLILGSGASQPALAELAERIAPGRVIFRAAVPEAEAMKVTRASDVLLVPLADVPEVAKSIPIKLYDFSAVGRPVVVAAAGEPARIAAEHQSALVVRPGDESALADAVRTLRDDPDDATALAERSRRFAVEHLRSAQIERLEGVLEAATSSGGSR
ncbi:glycosyltransferase family 4 protein [soil metagenome]